MKHSLEFMIVKWLDAIDDMIRINPHDKIMAKDEFPRPEHLFSFWDSRLENLENLTDQLGDKRIKTIGFVLEKSGSVFMNSYRRLVQLVLEALAEARDITKYLVPLVCKKCFVKELFLVFKYDFIKKLAASTFQ